MFVASQLVLVGAWLVATGINLTIQSIDTRGIRRRRQRAMLGIAISLSGLAILTTVTLAITRQLGGV